jgi:hypothetical protein
MCGSIGSFSAAFMASSSDDLCWLIGDAAPSCCHATGHRPVFPSQRVKKKISNTHKNSQVNF